MSEFVWEESPLEEIFSEYVDTLPAALFLTKLEGEEEETVEAAIAELHRRDILLDVENLDTGASGAKMQARLQMEKGLAEGSVKLRDFEEHDPLRLYLQELDDMPEMDISVSDGLTEKQMEKLAGAYLPKVVSLAYTYAGKGVLLMDLIQEGSLGLWQGLAEWNGEDIRPYLNRCIARAMAVAIALQARQNGVGARLRKAMEDYRRAEKEMLSRFGRAASVDEIGDFLGISGDAAGEISRMLQNAKTEKNDTAEDEAEEVDVDAENEVEATAYYQMRQRVAELLENLSDTDAKIISLRFGLESGTPMADDAIARKLGLPLEEVTARGAKALETLRNQ